MFEGAPLALRGVLLTGWTAVLRLRLGPRPSPKHILGWPIAAADADSITVTARSRLITAHNIVLVRDVSVVWTTVVRFERPNHATDPGRRRADSPPDDPLAAPPRPPRRPARLGPARRILVDQAAFDQAASASAVFASPAAGAIRSGIPRAPVRAQDAWS
ncbi:hypothetical protein ACIBSV_38300 [Embleya sp. NPDC050154]|uniref:hypothetical protein n=1 Tax=Embleya sp. NPDC050154 TaxID=3363988 RepID=UPI0037B530B6